MSRVAGHGRPRWRRALRASMRKSSSSRRRAANSSTRSHRRGTRAPQRRARLDDARRARRAPTGRRRTDSSMPGRCTLTTTCDPSGSCARYTWPIDAAATRLPVEARGTPRSTGDLELLLEHLGDAVARRRPHVVLQQCRARAAACGEIRSERVLTHLAQLHEHAAALLEREPEAPHRRARRAESSTSSLRPSPSDGPRPLRTAMRVISA